MCLFILKVGVGSKAANGEHLPGALGCGASFADAPLCTCQMNSLIRGSGAQPELLIGEIGCNWVEELHAQTASEW